jgi:YHS domain-containing protein
MSSLGESWIWIVLAIGIVWFFMRGARGGMLGALGGHGGYQGAHDGRPQPAVPAETVADAVSGEAVRTAQALSSVYQGSVYYFASKENRERFEAAPQEYAQKAAGHPAAAAAPAGERPRRRHGGCC